MKRITVTLDEKTAAWARLYAAKRSMSLSGLLRELLRKTMQELRGYESAMYRYLERKPWRLESEDAGYPSREEVNERSSVA